MSKAEDRETILLDLFTWFARKGANHWVVLMFFSAIFSALLPRALNDLTGKQQVFTNLQAARQKLSVFFQNQDIFMLTWVFCLFPSQYTFLLHTERLDFGSGPTWILALFLTFAFMSGWRSREHINKMRWRDRISQENCIETKWKGSLNHYQII